MIRLMMWARLEGWYQDYLLFYADYPSLIATRYVWLEQLKEKERHCRWPCTFDDIKEYIL